MVRAVFMCSVLVFASSASAEPVAKKKPTLTGVANKGGAETGSTSTLSQPTPTSPPSSPIQKWVTKIKQSRLTGVIPLKFLVSKSIEQFKVALRELEYDLLNKNGFPSFVTDQEFALNQKLNMHPWESKEQLKPGDDIALALRMSGADVAVIAPKSTGYWSIVAVDASNKPITVFAGKGPGFDDWKALPQWLQASLGFDGIVLDQRENTVLAVMFSANLAKAKKALVVKDSEGQYVLESNKQGLAMLSVTASEGPYVICSLLTSGDSVNKIPQGSKLILKD